MSSVMFVCHGNICRSPMAEFVFRDMAERAGIEVEAASSAISSEEIFCGVGNPVYPPVREILNSRGIDCSGKRATLLRKSDYEKYDRIIVMDGSNLRGVMRIFGGDPENKVSRLLDYTGRGGDVADPWYTRDFAVTERDIDEGCRGLLEALKREK